jgi:hypothetical protein
MGKYSRYDAKHDVIVVDVTGIVVDSEELIDEIFAELYGFIDSLKKKPWIISCWKDLKFERPDLAPYYGNKVAHLQSRVSGVVRYAANDPITRALIRAQHLKHRAEGTRSNIHETFEDALAAVNEARAKA